MHPAKLIRRALRFFRRSLQARYVAASVVLSTIALIAVGGFLSYSIGAGLFSARLQQVLKDSTRAVTEVQSTFSTASATDEATLQSLLNSVIPALESSASSEPRQVALLRSPGQASAQLLQSPISLNIETTMIPEDLRTTVRKTPGKLVYQSISLPTLDGNHPALVVGAPVDIPVAGSYELYLVYDLNSAQQTLDFVQNTLFFGGLILIFLIGGVAQFVSARLVAPIRITADVARQISEGALDRRVPSKGEDVVAQLAQSFNTMAEGLQNQIDSLSKLSTMQQRFVQDVSHELRTPLTTIKLSVAILEQRKDDLSAASAKQLNTLSGQIQRFERLLVDLLEISRYDANAVVAEFETADINGLVGLAIMNIQPLADSKGSRVIVDIPSGSVEAEVDARRFERILRNLLSNAIEHGESKPIEIRVAASAQAVAVSVTDHGIGMTKAQADHVFDRFWRADPARKRTSGGTGLGLAISIEDANIHGGSLKAYSKPNEGATFRLTIPRKQGMAVGASPLPLGPKRTQKETS